jgi:Sec-independent protein secretion pathway component TatC
MIMMQKNQDSTSVSIAKCLMVGLQIGLAGVVLCVLAAMLFYVLRGIGFLILFVSIPVGGFFVWRGTRRYLDKDANRLRCAIAYAARFFIMGAAFGFLMTAPTPYVAFGTFLTGAGGMVIGAFRGAFCGGVKAVNK